MSGSLVDAKTSLVSALEFSGATALEAFDRWVTKQPEKIAVTYGETGESFTYAAWGDLTDRIAANLVGAGVEAGDRVIVLSTSPLVCTMWMFAAWKARAIYTPINPVYRDELLSYSIRDAAPKLLVADVDLLGHVERACAGSMDGITIVSAGGEHSRAAPVERFTVGGLAVPRRPRWHEPANIIYTSGTTGPAKGVVLTHRWIGSYTWSQRLVTSPDDVMNITAPMYHVGGALIGFARAMWAGASVWLWDRFSATAYWERVKASGATIGGLLDVMVPYLMSAEPRSDDRMNTLNKVIMQPLPSNHHEVASRFGFDFVFAGFGQTESGLPISLAIEETPAGEGTPAELYAGYSHHEVIARLTAAGISVARGPDVEKGMMGSPIRFYEAAILDEFDQECEPDVAGQLAIRPRLPGTILTEYFGKPAETAKAFRNAWFHTGDSAKRNADGTYTFVDRISNRIRVRGENVSSFHVEDMITRCPGVDVVAVVGVPSQLGSEDEIVAFVVPAAGAEKADLIDALHRHCAENLPRFMRPSRFVIVTELPVTPTNKIEKYRLRSDLLAGKYGS
ncbi:crotonobetaine/carnitine-CoA ligase [Bradyrhizobium sp. USDA 4509]